MALKETWTNCFFSLALVNWLVCITSIRKSHYLLFEYTLQSDTNDRIAQYLKYSLAYTVLCRTLLYNYLHNIRHSFFLSVLSFSAPTCTLLEFVHSYLDAFLKLSIYLIITHINCFHLPVRGLIQRKGYNTLGNWACINLYDILTNQLSIYSALQRTSIIISCLQDVSCQFPGL